MLYLPNNTCLIGKNKGKKQFLRRSKLRHQEKDIATCGKKVIEKTNLANFTRKALSVWSYKAYFCKILPLVWLSHLYRNEKKIEIELGK